MADKKEHPSLAEIRNWQHDRITQFLLKELMHKFPHYKDLLPILSLEHAYKVNHRVGAQEVLEAIARFCEHGEV